MNNNLWKYALPLLATVVSVGASIWLRPSPPVSGQAVSGQADSAGQVWSAPQDLPGPAQTVAGAARRAAPPLTTEHCTAGERKPAGLTTRDLDNMLRACTELTH